MMEIVSGEPYDMKMEWKSYFFPFFLSRLQRNAGQQVMRIVVIRFVGTKFNLKLCTEVFGSTGFGYNVF